MFIQLRIRCTFIFISNVCFSLQYKKKTVFPPTHFPFFFALLVLFLSKQNGCFMYMLCWFLYNRHAVKRLFLNMNEPQRKI